MLIPVFGDWRLPTHESVHTRGDDDVVHCQAPEQCVPGLILPLWLPHADGNPFIVAYRAILYGTALAYLLFGVSIVTDRIVSATEVMASHKRTVTITLKSGGKTTAQVLVWHPVVAALTFGVVGTSSPEILLPLIEIFHRDFQGDELGPSLIVGSGAYHLLIITSICLLSVRDTNPKPIKDLHLFFTTATFAIAAYAWVYLILAQFSPGIIELWEAVLTLAMFPVLILSAWVVARRFPQRLFARFCRRIRNTLQPKKPRLEHQGSATSDEPTSPTTPNIELEETTDLDDEEESPEDEKRRKLGAIMQRLKLTYPDKSMAEIEEIAKVQMLDDTAKNAAFYRLQATKAISGTRNVPSIEKIKEKLEQGRSSSQAPSTSITSTVQTVGFVTASHTCQESCEATRIGVKRWGAGVAETSLVLDFETFEGTAKASVNFEPTAGKVKFAPGQTMAEIVVPILDDDIFEEEPKFFEVKLSNPLLEIVSMPRASSRSSSDTSRLGTTRVVVPTSVEVATPETKVCILDDDHCGAFMFERNEQAIPDNIDIAKIKVVRSIGTKGSIAVPYRITPGTAKPRHDYVASSRGVLHFSSGQVEAFVDVKIIDKNRFGEVYTFFVELLPPKKESNDVKSTIGDPVLGDPKRIQIGICEDEELELTLDRLLKMTDLAEHFMAASWKDQIKDALTVFHDEDSKSACSRVKAYLIHLLSLPWKVLVALLPPPSILHGWLAYVSLLCLMGLIAALIGDCAGHLGCTIGLKDTVTAITLIPFGMGLPDTFASRRAAMYEKTADAAIGQITGSNAVTVFLGMGMAWTIGAAYRTSRNDRFTMPASDFGFSVVLYCSFAFVGVLLLLLRRLPPVRGELGGPTAVRNLSAMLLISLWLLFIVLSGLDSYCIIQGL